jgi:hypothetical protein
MTEAQRHGNKVQGKRSREWRSGTRWQMNFVEGSPSWEVHSLLAGRGSSYTMCFAMQISLQFSHGPATCCCWVQSTPYHPTSSRSVLLTSSHLLLVLSRFCTPNFCVHFPSPTYVSHVRSVQSPSFRITRTVFGERYNSHSNLLPPLLLSSS